MTTFIFGPKRVWSEIKLICRSSDPKIGAIAYLSKPELLNLGPDDQLIVDASDHAIAYSQTKKDAVLDLSEKAKVYSLENLHAKTLIVGETLITGSMNASGNSEDILTESAIITDHIGAVQQARLWLKELIETGKATLIDDAERSRISKVKIKREPRPHRKIKERSSPSSKPTDKVSWFYFLATPKKIREDVAESLNDRATELKSDDDKDVWWLRFYRNHSTAAAVKEGDHIFLGWRSHDKSNRISVTPFCQVVATEKDAKSRVIYYSQPSSADRYKLTWKEFRSLAEDNGLILPTKCINKKISDREAALRLENAWAGK